MTQNEIRLLEQEARERRDATIEGAKKKCAEAIHALRVVGGLLSRSGETPGKTGQNGPMQRGELVTMLREIVKEEPNDSLFTIKTISERLVERGCPANPNSVSSGLRRLLEQGRLIEVVEHGSGRRPTSYRKRIIVATATTWKE